MKQDVADTEIARMKAVLETLKSLQQDEEREVRNAKN